jgi:hypothetical protein
METDFDTNSVPSEWRQWLSGIRTEVPTEAESQQVAHAALKMQAKVAALDAAEAKERLARASGLGGGGAAAPAAAFAGQVAAAAAAAAASSPSGAVGAQAAAAAAAASSATPPAAEPAAAATKLKPFRAGSSTKQAVPSTPSGQGESFVPGAWVPPGAGGD